MLALLTALILAGPPVPLPAMGGGIQVGEVDNHRWARFVEGAGLDTVQVTLYAKQRRWDGHRLEFGHDAWVKLPGLREEVAEAQKRGLKVMLVLRVELDLGEPANRHLWHGMIWPTDDALAAWFESYRAFARWGAERAAEIGADALLVGHEMNSMTSTVVGPHLPDLLAYHLAPDRTAHVVASRLACAGRAEAMQDTAEPDGARFASLRAQLEAEEETRRRWSETVSGIAAPLTEWPIAMPAKLAERRRRYEAFWRSLVDELRPIYRGPIGYGANFDQFHEVGFWDAMDVIGISSYFSLRALAVADLDAALEEGWRRVAEKVEAVAGPAGRPVVLHELGWSRKAGSTIRPYSYVGVEPIEVGEGEAAELTCIHWLSQPDEPGERERAMAALLAVVEGGGFPSLRGFSLWKLSTEPGHVAHEPFVVVLPPTWVDREADDGFARLAADLLARLAERAP